MAAFLDNCRFNPTAGGTTDWTFSTAMTGYQSPTLSGAVNGTKYKFIAISADLSQWEIAEGAYNSGTGVFARTTVLYNSSGTGTASGQSGAGTKINFSAAPQVAIIGVKEDLLAFDELNSFSTAQQEQSRINLLAERIIVFNGTIVESHSGNAVTFAVKTFGGNDPSTTTPVIFCFPNISGGDAYVSVTSALSITVPSGATLGASNSTGFRVWLAAFNDSGTVRLAVRACSQSTTIISPIEGNTASSTLTPGNSAHVFYTTGAGVTSKNWMWLAYASYESGLATAGTWNVSPTTITLMDKATPRPGTMISFQTSLSLVTLSATDTATHAMSGLTMTPLSTSSIIDVECDGQIFLRTGAINGQGTLAIYRGGSAIAPSQNALYANASTDLLSTARPRAVERPNTSVSQTYNAVAQNIATASGLVQYATWNFTIRELMG